MAGTSKHYVASIGGGSTILLDHAIIPNLIDHIVAAPGSIGDRVRRQREVTQFASDKQVPWRKRLLDLWKVAKDVGVTRVSLSEVRVRPNNSQKNCRFRDVARNYRSAKPKPKTVQFQWAYTPSPAATLGGSFFDTVNSREELVPAPSARRNNRNPAQLLTARTPVTQQLASNVGQYLEMLDLRRRRGMDNE